MRCGWAEIQPSCGARQNVEYPVDYFRVNGRGGPPDVPDSWLLRYRKGVEPFASSDPDSGRISWNDPGVHQNLAFPVQPDPQSGMHCWLQKVRVEPALPEDRYGDVYVDRRRSREVYREWLAMTRASVGPDGQRRPEFLMRPVKPKRAAYRVGAEQTDQ